MSHFEWLRTAAPRDGKVLGISLPNTRCSGPCIPPAPAFHHSSRIPPRLPPTIRAGIIHQDDLLQQEGRGGVQDAVHRPQQR